MKCHVRYDWPRETPEQQKQREIRSYEQQIIALKRQLAETEERLQKLTT